MNERTLHRVAVRESPLDDRELLVALAGGLHAVAEHQCGSETIAGAVKVANQTVTAATAEFDPLCGREIPARYAVVRRHAT